MTVLEQIALVQLEKEIIKISDYIKENEATPERQVQHVLPFMNRNVKEAFRIIDAFKQNNKTNG